MTGDIDPPASAPQPPAWQPGWTPAGGTAPGADPGQPGPAPDPSLTPAPPAPAAKKGGIRKRWIVLGVVVAVLAAGGYQLWQDEQAYKTGHAAYLAADCASAVGPLRKAGGNEKASSSDTDTELAARAELQECEALLAAGDLNTQGKPADAVLAYSDFVTKYPRSPLLGPARSSAQGLMSTSTEAVATVALCDVLEMLEAIQFVATPAATLPTLLYACGQAYEAAREWAEALAVYGRFRAEYADHALAGDVEIAFARTTLAETAAAGAGNLPQPGRGTGAGTAGQATVVIVNDSPDALSMVFSGPDVRVEELASCGECVEYTGDGPPDCPNIGPVAEYVLAPGSYEVVVKSGSGAGTIPFRGTWTLDPGEVYESCFYIVTG